MNPQAVGTRITVISNENGHSYVVGRSYTVHHVDNDGTFKAADDNGRVGNWLRWSECRLAGTSDWSKIAAGLPEPLVVFLGAFDGIGEIRLGSKTADAVLASLPDLHERIVAAAMTTEGAASTSHNRPHDLDTP